MNEKDPKEIAYRRLAAKLFDKGKSVAEILARIPRSCSWLFKWKKRSESGGRQALDSLPKATINSPQRYCPGTVDLALRIRKRLEKSTAGLVCPREIRQEILLRRLMNCPPSLANIRRWLKQAGVTGAQAKPEVSAYFPTFQMTDDLVIFSCDWISRYLRGGEKVFAFHTIDFASHALAQTLHTDKATASACAHLLHAFTTLGLPDFLQIDNDAAFTGLGYTKPVFGKIVRLVLYLSEYTKLFGRMFAERPVNTG